MQQSQQVGLWIQIQCLVKESKGNFFLFYALSAVCFLLQHQDSMAALPQFLRSRAGAPDCAWILQFHGTYPREVAGDSLHGVADVVEDQAFFSHLESLPAVRAPKVEGFVQKRHRSFVLTFQDPCRGFFHVRTFHCLPLFFSRMRRRSTLTSSSLPLRAHSKAVVMAFASASPSFDDARSSNVATAAAAHHSWRCNVSSRSSTSVDTCFVRRCDTRGRYTCRVVVALFRFIRRLSKPCRPCPSSRLPPALRTCASDRPRDPVRASTCPRKR
mmetsp:Transcript_1387/g.8560  ORF Transcript_1387/g.8560 Transcript_1387/m.8560 type:complete len:271 (-) Transcript_1387:82-894(-)